MRVGFGFEWFVAWRYLRERDRKASRAPFIVGMTLVTLAAALFFAAYKTKAPHPAALHLGATNWKQIYEGAGLGAMVLGVLVAVFGYLYMMQSIFTTISTFGVFLGTWALVIALSVMNGFEVDLRQKILGSNAHVLVSKKAGGGAFLEWRAIEQQLDGVPGVVAHTPYLTSEVVIAANSNYSPAIIKGIMPKTVGKVTDLERNLEKDAKLSRLWPILSDGGVGEYMLPDGGREPDAAGEPDASEDEVEIDAGPEDDEPPPDFSGGTATEPEPATEPETEPEPAAEPEPDDEYVPPIFDGDASVDETPDAGVPSVIPKGKKRKGSGLDPRVSELDGILVGKELAKNLRLYVGQEVQVVSPIGQDTPTGQVPRVKNFRVAGSFYSGMYEYDTRFSYVTLPALQRFLSLGDEVTGIEIKVADINDTGGVVAALQSRLGDAYRVQDWKELNRNLFSALKLEKIAMFLVLTIIILVASFSIISNLIMVVVEKAREIAILKGMGASDPGIMRIFMIEGLYIGLLGTGFGITIGVATCWALERFGLPLDPDVYYINKLPVAMDFFAVAMVAFAGVAISFIATIYPSYVAARLRPVDGLRYE